MTAAPGLRGHDGRPAWFVPQIGRRGIRPCSPFGWAIVAAYLTVLVAAGVTVGTMGQGGDVAYRFGYLAGGLLIMGLATALFVRFVRRKTARIDGV